LWFVTCWKGDQKADKKKREDEIVRKGNSQDSKRCRANRSSVMPREKKRSKLEKEEAGRHSRERGDDVGLLQKRG